MEYQHQAIEAKWRARWQANKTYEVNPKSGKPKFYVLDMFPYPSGAGLHVGHPLGYVASDIIARYKRLKGFEVLHPMGYDAFGLPAEQYAIQTGIHPAVSTAENIERYRAQLDNLGFSFDWSRQVNTSDPQYYRWTQQLFILLFEHYYDLAANKARPIAELIARFQSQGNIGLQAACNPTSEFSAADWAGFSNKERDDILMNYRLAYRKVGYVNWCEALGSVLANDEVVNGVSERGGHPVTKREMLQWSLRITAYAERLLQGLETVDFSESIKTQQRNWIGRSKGAQIFFELEGYPGQSIEVFSTRPDTLYGATFMVLAPEHPLVAQITTEAQKAEVAAYLDYVGSRSERERMAEVKRVTGADTGAKVKHPLTGELLPIWISEYVLFGYGTGAIMAVPAEDERDNRFAQQFGLPIIEVMDKSAYPQASIGDKLGTLINSPLWEGLPVAEAIDKALQVLQDKGIGQGRITYRLRDANFSRQRYWGEPIPILYDAEGCAQVERQLPLELPPLDNFKPTSGGSSPLARLTDWVNTPEGYTRETDTMPGFAGSSWYFLRYMDPHNAQAPFSPEAVQYWQNVDLYVGGAEHAVGHLLYSRCWHMFLHDLGLVPTAEPYQKLLNQGMIQGIIEYIFLLKEKRDGRHVFVSDTVGMSLPEEQVAKIHVRSDLVKPSGGVTNAYLDAEGIEGFKQWMPEYADAIFELDEKGQLGTYSEVGKMSKRYHNVVNPDEVVAQYGADCFRMYEMFLGPLEQSKPWDPKNIEGTYRFLRRFWAQFYGENGEWLVTDEAPNPEELRALHFAIKKVNTDIQGYGLNTCVAHFMTLLNELRRLSCHKRAILREFVLLMAPFAPHISEELWEALGEQGSIHQVGSYPEHNEAFLELDTIEYPICVNGKVRSKHSFAADAPDTLLEETALSLDEVQRWLEGKSVKKVVIVPKRMINIVV